MSIIGYYFTADEMQCCCSWILTPPSIGLAKVILKWILSRLEYILFLLCIPAFLLKYYAFMLLNLPTQDYYYRYTYIISAQLKEDRCFCC